MTLIECSSTKAYSVDVYDYNGKRYLSIFSMYKTKADPEWKRSKGVTFPYNGDADLALLKKVFRAVKETIKNN